MSRRHVILFQPRFARKVKELKKPHTIRPERADGVRVQVGDTLDLREWSGLPYRSKQRKLIERPCVRERGIVIHTARGVEVTRVLIRVDGVLITPGEAELLAMRDGFDNAIAMVCWIEATHGLPFYGRLIEWTP